MCAFGRRRITPHTYATPNPEPPKRTNRSPARVTPCMLAGRERYAAFQERAKRDLPQYVSDPRFTFVTAILPPLELRLYTNDVVTRTDGFSCCLENETLGIDAVPNRTASHLIKRNRRRANA